MVKDGVPMEAEVEWVVQRLQNKRAGGAVKDACGGSEGVVGGGKAGRKGERDGYQGRRQGGRMRTPDGG